jgi:hypothetical protein
VNLAGKVTSIIAGMAAGADSIDDLDMDPVRRDGPVGHSKVGGRQVLRRGLLPLDTTLSTAQGVPAIAGIRLRGTRRLRQRRGVDGERGDRHRPRRRRHRADSPPRRRRLRNRPGRGRAGSRERFSVVLAKNWSVTQAIASIRTRRGPRCTTSAPSPTPTPGQLISDAEVAEVPLRLRIRRPWKRTPFGCQTGSYPAASSVPGSVCGLSMGAVVRSVYAGPARTGADSAGVGGSECGSSRSPGVMRRG